MDEDSKNNSLGDIGGNSGVNVSGTSGSSPQIVSGIETVEVGGHQYMNDQMEVISGQGSA